MQGLSERLATISATGRQPLHVSGAERAGFAALPGKVCRELGELLEGLAPFPDQLFENSTR